MPIDVRNSFKTQHPLIKLIFDILLVFIVFFVVFLLTTSVFAAIKGLKMPELFDLIKNSEDLDLVRSSQAISSISLFLIPPMIISLLYSKSVFRFFSLDKSANINSYISIFFLIVFSLPIVNSLALFNDGIHLPSFLSNLEDYFRNSGIKTKAIQENLLSTSSVNDLIFNLIVFAVIPAIGEEVFFRGLFQKHLIEWTKNEHIGILLTAMLFSGFHFQFSNFIPIMFLGIVLGYLYVWSKSLWLSIFAHFVNNAMAVIVSFFYFKKHNTLNTEIEKFGTNADTFFYTIFSLLLFGVVLVLIYRREMKKNQA